MYCYLVPWWEIEVDPGEHANDLLLRLVVLGWDIEIVDGHNVACFDPKLDTRSTVVRV